MAAPIPITTNEGLIYHEWLRLSPSQLKKVLYTMNGCAYPHHKRQVHRNNNISQLQKNPANFVKALTDCFYT